MNDCIFCDIANHNAKAWVVHETDKTIAFFDRAPMNPYHTIVIPKEHHINIFDIPMGILQSVTATVKDVATTYHEKLGIRNLQIVSSNGRDGQQDVDHFHFHIAPRSKGDAQDLIWQSKDDLTEEFDSLLKVLGCGRVIGQNI